MFSQVIFSKNRQWWFGIYVPCYFPIFFTAKSSPKQNKTTKKLFKTHGENPGDDGQLLASVCDEGVRVYDADKRYKVVQELEKAASFWPAFDVIKRLKNKRSVF